MKKEEHTKGLSLLKKSENSYPQSPEKAQLECFKNLYKNNRYWIEFSCPEFTSLCPITSQPDFGGIKILYQANELCLESKSLKLYLFSFRNHPSFHEEIVNRILDDCSKICKPKKMLVKGIFRPRGGISLTVKAKYSSKNSQ